MNLGERIRQLREARGWNQKQLAERSDVHPSVISLMERNSRNGARPETLVKLANALGVTVGYLLGEDAAPFITSVGVPASPHDGATEFTLTNVPRGREALVSDLEPYRQAIQVAREHGLGPDELEQLIRTAANLFAKK